MAQIPYILTPSSPKKPFQGLKILLYVVLISTILYFGKTLFIPLCFSLQISFILFPICKWLENKGISQSISIVIALFLLSFLLIAIIYLLTTQLLEFMNEWQILKSKLSEMVANLNNYIAAEFGLSKEIQFAYLNNAVKNSGSHVFSFAQDIVYSFSESIYFLFMIPIFSALILYNRQLLVSVLYQIFPSEEKGVIHKILVDTIGEYYNFIKGMLLVYLIVGILNSIGLVILGIPHPFLFGFIASILTFIPYVGIIVSSLLPITVSWITYNSIWYPIGVIGVFSLVQILEAYIIFPFAVGNRLRINTLVILITIIIGGILWGAAGMILFIPMISILKLIAEQTESLKVLSTFLGDGKK